MDTIFHYICNFEKEFDYLATKINQMDNIITTLTRALYQIISNCRILEGYL